MAGCSIEFRSNQRAALVKSMFPEVQNELSNRQGYVTVGAKRSGNSRLISVMRQAAKLKVEEALSRGLKEAFTELKEIATATIYDKDKRGFTSVTGNLIAGMGATLLTYNSGTGKTSARMPMGMLVPISDGGYGRPLRDALGLGEVFWLPEWGTYSSGQLKIPAIVRYHDGTQIPSVRNKDYSGLYLSRPTWFNNRLYKGETDAKGLKGYVERRKYAQSLKSKMPRTSKTMVRMEFFSAMPYTEFVDQQKGYHFMEAIRAQLNETALYVFAKHFKVK